MIIYKGNDITAIPERKLRKIIRKDIQMIFQDPFASLNPRKTLKKTLIEPLHAHNLYHNTKERTDRVKELLEIVGLSASYINRYRSEERRVGKECIARWLV